MAHRCTHYVSIVRLLFDARAAAVGCERVEGNGRNAVLVFGGWHLAGSPVTFGPSSRRHRAPRDVRSLGHRRARRVQGVLDLHVSDL